ncbi:MAG: hypothetical protein AB1414_11955, partial [bacterium]
VNPSIATTQTDGQGGFSVVFTVDKQAGCGTVTVSARGSHCEAYSPFVILPRIIEVNPSSGIVGTSVTVSGDGFGANEVLIIDLGVNPIIATTQTDGQGGFSVVFTVDKQAGCGTVTVSARGSHCEAFSPFVILPRIIEVNPSSGIVGTSVTVSGDGFGANEVLIIDLGVNPSIATTQTDGQGGFSVVFTVDKQAGCGTVTVSARGTCCEAFSPFVILPRIIAVNPSSGTVGTSVTVSGDGFGANEKIVIDFGVNPSIATTQTDGQGGFIVVFTVDKQAGCGTVTVSARGSYCEALSKFVILPRIIAVNPSSGTVGTSVTVSGDGFGANEVLIIDFGVNPSIATTQTDGQGGFIVVFTVDKQAGCGTVTVSARGSHCEAYSKFVILPRIIEVNPSSGTVGTSVTVSGDGFGANEVLIIDFGVNPSIATTQTDGQGGFIVVFTVDKQAGCGTVTVSAKGSHCQAFRPFVILPRIIEVNPSSGTVGSSVTVSGDGFGANEVLIIDFGVNPSIATTQTDGQGGFIVVFTVDKQAGCGTVTVSARGSHCEAFSPFVILPRIIEVNPSSGTIGTVITVSGNGFGSFDSIIIGFGTNPTITTTISDNLGVFSTSFTIDTQPSGTTTVKAKGTHCEAESSLLLIASDLWLKKSNPAGILRSGTLTYTISYGNKGNLAIGSVTITDLIDTSLGTLSHTYLWSNFGTPTIVDGYYFSWDIGTLTPGTSGDLIFKIIPSRQLPASSTIYNTAQITTTPEDFDTTNNIATCTTHILLIDLVISKHGPAEVISGKELTYEINYDNCGNKAVGDVVICDTLPGSVTFVSSSVTPATSTNGVLTWEIGTVTPWSHGSFTITVKVDDLDGSMTLTNVVKIISTSTVDNNPDNNQATCTTHVTKPMLDLWIEKKGPQEIVSGDLITYQISYDNSGNTPAGNVIIKDVLPKFTNYATNTVLGTPTITYGTLTILEWNIGTVSPASYGYFELTVETVKEGEGVITNVIEISTSTLESNFANNRATWTTKLISKEIDLEIYKQSAKDEIPAGEEMMYYIKYRNLSNITVTGVIITDVLPGSVTFVSSMPVPSGISAQRLTWNIGTISAGYEGYIDLKVKIGADIPASKTLTNVATITCDYNDSNITNNLATATTHVITPIADMVVRKYGIIEVAPGEEMEYQILYYNQGNATAKDVSMRDTLPEGVTYVTDTSGLKATVTGTEVSWYIGTVLPGSSSQFSMTVLVATSTLGTLTNVVEIYQKGTLNSRATWTTQCYLAEVDLSIYKCASEEVKPGEELSYWINYANNGNVAAGSVSITDTLPEDVEFVSSSLGTPTNDNNNLTWNIGTIPPGSHSSFILNVKVKDNVPGSTTLINVVEIAFVGTDTDYTNNRATVTTHVVVPAIDLMIRKFAPSSAAPAQILTYDISYRNIGNAQATNVIITDILPEGVQYAMDTSGLPVDIQPGVITWQVGILPKSYLWKSFKMRVLVGDLPGSTTLTNVIKIDGWGDEINPVNNQATVTTHITRPVTDLKIHKKGNKQVIAGDEIIYDIGYRNIGNIPALDVKIIDTLPAGVSYATDTSGFPLIITGNRLTWLVGTLASGGGGRFRLIADVRPEIQGSSSLTNLIEITSITNEENLSDNQSTWTTHVVPPIIDLRVYKWGPKKVTSGKKIKYRINYGNNGNVEVKNVHLIDTLPEGVDFVADDSGLPCTIIGREVKWEITNLPKHTHRTFILIGRVSGVAASSTLSNKIEITLLPQDIRPENNSFIVRTHVVDPRADLIIRKQGTGARPGHEKTYYITYWNDGTGRADNIRIVDYLPREVIYVSSSPEASYDSTNHTVSWNIPALGPDDFGNCQIKVNVLRNLEPGTQLRNEVIITTTTPESNYKNNKDIDTEPVVSAVDPNDKLVSPQWYVVGGGELNYKIRFENVPVEYGTHAIDITITDNLDTTFDRSTLQWGEISVGEGTYTVENYNRGSLTYSYDQTTGLIRWEFKGINLMPNTTPPVGEGYVSFKVKATNTLSSGTEVRNKASIIFDFADPVETPTSTTVVDLDVPSSKVNTLSPYQTSTTFLVSWIGQDTVGTISYYTIYVSENNGSYTCWLNGTRAVSADFKGVYGNSYAFYSLAEDTVWQVESPPAQPDARTIISPLSYFRFATLSVTSIYSGGTVAVTLTACEADGTPIDTFNGTVILQDKVGYLQEVIFNGTSTRNVVVTIPQSPNAGTDTIFAYFENQIRGTSSSFLVLINKDTGGTVTLTTAIGITRVELGTFTEDFYITINPSPAGVNIPENGLATSICEITMYGTAGNLLTGSLSVYLEIPYLDADQDGVVDGTAIDEDSLRLHIFRDNNWWITDNSGVDTTRNVVYGQANSLAIFIPIGTSVAPETLGKVSVYPNPFKPNSDLGHTHITFGAKNDLTRRLTRYATIKIYDISGELIRTLEVVPGDKGQKIWRADNDSGQKIASGIYIYLITNPQGEKCIGKMAIIR